MSEGARRRDEGTEQVDRDGSPGMVAWRAAADEAIAGLAEAGRAFTAADVRAVVGDPPGHFNAMGSRFLAAARAGVIERVGYERSARPSLHAHPVAVWRGKP